MGLIFLILFIDLIGFSIIFPLVPAILEHYLQADGPDGILGSLVQALTDWTGSEDSTDWRVMTLFGGVLGSIYSLLQFIFSPIWGALSDRIGRRPVLAWTILGTTLSYLIWFVSGSFELLLLSRVVGGIMSGNISTATAAMADSTSRENRSKGMGIVGAAFGLGFIVGPAIGGVSSFFDLTVHFPDSTSFGVHPFSMAALVAAVLSGWNLLWLLKRFRETLPEERRGAAGAGRSANPLRLLASLADPAIGKVNLAYFLFLVAFSGMEFTLTFLATDRLGYGPWQITGIFVFVGLVVAFVQGGLVRRVAPKYGEKRVALAGLLMIAPGLGLLAYASSTAMLYTGLTLMGVGSAFAIPTLTALVSLLAPEARQGEAIGIFRSLGSLARAVGPFAAAYLYYLRGSELPYLVGAAMMVLPLLILTRIEQPKV